MSRLNYGVAVSSEGDFQIIDTTAGVGIRDDYSEVRSDSFTFFVAPHEWMDERLGLDKWCSEDEYLEARRIVCRNEVAIKMLIVSYHCDSVSNKSPTWSESHGRS